jgi:osmotically-inducible protein OsmY
MKRIWLLLLLWAMLWLGGSVFSAWALQQNIQHAANSVLVNQSVPGEPARLRAVAQGRHVYLEGIIHRESDRQRACDLVMKETRLEGTLEAGATIPPASQVTAERVVLDPRPVGWGVLAASSDVIRLRGATGSEFEAQSIATSLTSDTAISRLLHNNLATEHDALVEADDLQPTLTSPLPLTEKELQASVLAFARWGQPWQTLDLDQPLEAIRRRLVELGLPADTWTAGVSTEVERVRDARFNWRTSEAQRQNLNRQPPGHVVLAVRADTILLRGELGSPSLCRLVADAVKHLPGDRRVIDEIVHNSRRRPESDAQRLATTLPTLPGGLLTKVLAVGTPSAGWKAIDLATVDVEDESTLGIKQLPEGLDPRLVLPDVLACLRWIHSIDDSPMRPTDARPLPHLIIAAVADRIYVRGAVAEESTRSQLENAARKFYSSRTVDCAIHVDANCEPSADILQTTTALPVPPAINTTGMLAIAVPGWPWKAKPMRADFLDSDGLTRSNLLPDYVTSAQVMPDLIGIADEVRAHLAKVINGAPGIPLQAP